MKPSVVVDLLGLDKLSNAFGFLLLFQGIGAIVGPPIAGLHLRILKKYDTVCLLGIRHYMYVLESCMGSDKVV